MIDKPEIGARLLRVHLWTGAIFWHVYQRVPSDITSSPSLLSFKQRLKMHLFRRSYSGLSF